MCNVLQKPRCVSWEFLVWCNWKFEDGRIVVKTSGFVTYIVGVSEYFFNDKHFQQHTLAKIYKILHFTIQCFIPWFYIDAWFKVASCILFCDLTKLSTNKFPI